MSPPMPDPDSRYVRCVSRFRAPARFREYRPPPYLLKKDESAELTSSEAPPWQMKSKNSKKCLMLNSGY